MSTSAARRYAEALIEAVWDAEADPAEAGSAAAAELDRLAQTIDEVPSFRNALENPSYAAEERTKALEAVTEKLELSGRVRSFARLVVERGRAGDIADIAETFRKLMDNRAGRVRARVTSAHPLDEAAQGEIKQALERRTGKKVEIDANVDPSLIGGIRAEVGTLVFDGSIRAELDTLRERLTSDA